MEIRYVEQAPGAGLADAVRCYWSIRGDLQGATSALTNRVLPDNCIDVIFDLRAIGGGSAIIVGPMLAAEVIPQATDVDLLGVRFCPGAATEFLDVNASELAERDTDAAAVWHDARALTEQLQESAVDGRPAILDAHLLRRRKARREAALARIVTAAIERAHGVTTVLALTQSLGVNERKLQRTFDAAVGIGPKQVIKVQRFRVAAALVGSRSESLSRIAALCGYADQAHFTHDFATLAGLSPKAFRAERRLVGFLQD